MVELQPSFSYRHMMSAKKSMKAFCDNQLGIYSLNKQYFLLYYHLYIVCYLYINCVHLLCEQNLLKFMNIYSFLEILLSNIYQYTTGHFFLNSFKNRAIFGKEKRSYNLK